MSFTMSSTNSRSCPRAFAQPALSPSGATKIAPFFDSFWSPKCALMYPFDPPVSTSLELPPFQWNPKIYQ
jgi:hypothetical protein